MVDHPPSTVYRLPSSVFRFPFSVFRFPFSLGGLADDVWLNIKTEVFFVALNPGDGYEMAHGGHQ